jgi:fatty-acyl-CoA synthase
LTAPITRNRERTLPTLIEELASRLEDAPALLSDREQMTYRQLFHRANQYARWALAQGLAKGDVVGLLMTNRPEYIACWLGITSVGAVVALLNTNLTGASLAHCIQIASVSHLIVAAEFETALEGCLIHLDPKPVVWLHGSPIRSGGGDQASTLLSSLPRLDTELNQFPGVALSLAERRPPTIDDRALLIYTSGTTGLPKAANVSHARVLQWGLWFAGMMEAQPSDRMYNCLPMYHSVGGVLVPGATLAVGAALVIRERFSASQFWSDIQRWQCTGFQYIGELCRYLLLTPPHPGEATHDLRIACGNGLAAEVWEAFQSRFRIPQILEFYAATEGGVSLFNVQGKPGAIGHIPSYLAHRFAPALVRFDVEKGEPVRNEDGFCVKCAPHEAGEALGKLDNDPSAAGSRFEGYTNRQDSEKRILRDVFAPGDAWVRTGDLMRKDEKGFFYFVDRIGDTFRWKGENVATSEVAKEIAAFPGVSHVNVYGVTIPGAEGRAGMAALVTEEPLDLAAFRHHLVQRLPSYARPVFLRVLKEAAVTGTFKYSKTDLVREGFHPGLCADPVYFDHPGMQGFVPLDPDLFNQIQQGSIRL